MSFQFRSHSSPTHGDRLVPSRFVLAIFIAFNTRTYTLCVSNLISQSVHSDKGPGRGSLSRRWQQYLLCCLSHFFFFLAKRIFRCLVKELWIVMCFRFTMRRNAQANIAKSIALSSISSCSSPACARLSWSLLSSLPLQARHGCPSQWTWTSSMY